MKGLNRSLKDLLPEGVSEKFPPVDRCIYCPETRNLTDEHIIPLGLGGKMLLPRSSCLQCNKITSAYEHTCLRTMYGPLRLLYDLPTRRKKTRPKTLPLKVKVTSQAEWTRVQVPQEEYPFLVIFPLFDVPKMMWESYSSDDLRGAVSKTLWLRGASPHYSFHDLLSQLSIKLGVQCIEPTGKAHVLEFCQMIAKIAHSFAVSQVGINGFHPFLKPYILTSQLSDCDKYIGSTGSNEQPTSSLHEISLGLTSGNHLVVRLRLLAPLGTPTYWIIVGTPQ